MKKFTDSRKLYIAILLAASNFWIPIAVLYHQSRGATLEQVLSLLGFHYICIVLLEYPTGIIGDRLGYRKSIAWGNGIMAATFFLLAIPGPIEYYFFCVFLMAIGRTFSSGSDTAFFHHLSSHFQTELPRLKFVATIWTVVTMTVGGALGSANTVYTYILTGITMAIAMIVVLRIHNPGEVPRTEKGETNVFHHAKEGLLYAYRHTQLFVLILISMFALGFYTGLKWFYNPLFELATINVVYWGAIISGFSIMKAIGMRWFVRLPLLAQLVLYFLAFIPLAWSQNIILLLAGLGIMNLLFGSFETVLTLKINAHAQDKHRAATHSLYSLVIRLFSSVYLFVAGYLVDLFTLQIVLLGTAAVLFLSMAASIFFHQPKRIRAIVHELV